MTTPATIAYRHAQRAGEIAYAIQHGYITGADVIAAQARAKAHADKAEAAATTPRAKAHAAVARAHAMAAQAA